MQHLGELAGRDAFLPSITKNQKNMLKGKKLGTSKLKTVNISISAFYLRNFPGCKSVTVRFSNLMIYRVCRADAIHPGHFLCCPIPGDICCHPLQ